ncbi:hypothetical protein H6F32_16340 [Anabaena sp. FACHB-1237]|uniref:hypothetical protein n=1 Tax=Anabaena sp. FACHB-1237 TaxID=2692769 RepID=UPI00168044CD|nr:hypothetical protein [Anabaena sp. FACHB-1237]MBD2139103.1 hypothetical protein [Anabaena sp. FACHB-1237]
MLNKQQVVDELRQFLSELMDMAVNLGYISLEDKKEFIKPALKAITPLSCRVRQTV